MDGTTKIFKPKSFWFNWKHRLTVKVLPPIPAEKVKATDTTELANEVHDLMVETLAECKLQN
jgi:1-acyl-sn-glycerol-3-phosphate acyltransferase